MAPVISVHNHEADATVTVAVQATTFETTLSHMTSTLSYDAIYLLDSIIDETTFDTLNLMGCSPPIVKALEGQTKILSQRINRDAGFLKVQMSRIIYVTVPVIDADSGAYNERLVPDKSTVDVATLSVFTHPDQRIGLVAKLRTGVPEIFGTLTSVSFNNFIAQGAEIEDNPLVIYRDAGSAIGGHHYAANGLVAASFMPLSMPTVAPSVPPTFSPSTMAPTCYPTAQPSETKIVTVSVVGNVFDIELEGMAGELDMSDVDILMDLLDKLVEQTLSVLKSNLPSVANITFLSQVIEQSFQVVIDADGSKAASRNGGSSRLLKSDKEVKPSHDGTSIVGADEEERKKEKKEKKEPLVENKAEQREDSPSTSHTKPKPPTKEEKVISNIDEIEADNKPKKEEKEKEKDQKAETVGSPPNRDSPPKSESPSPAKPPKDGANPPNNRLDDVNKQGGGQSEVFLAPPITQPSTVTSPPSNSLNIHTSTATSQPSPSPTNIPDSQLGTLKLRISRTVFFDVPASYDISLLPDASVIDVATVSVFARPDHDTWNSLRHSEMTDAFRNIEDGNFIDFIYNETPSLEIWERPPAEEGSAGSVGVDSSETHGKSSGEIWETPGNTDDREGEGGAVKDADVTGDSGQVLNAIIDVPDECDTQKFIQKGGISMEVVYNYDLLYRDKDAGVRGDIIELDRMIPDYLQTVFMLACDDDQDVGDNGVDDETSGVFWINRGYLDAPDRRGVCTSREGMTASEYNLGCTPMVGSINVFVRPLADREKVKEKVLQSIQMANFETKGKSWVVYVGDHSKNDLSSSTNIVAGATESSWTEQTVGGVTIKSVLIYGAVAVFAALAIIIMAVLFSNAKRKQRNRNESEKFKELQNKRRARTKAKRNAMANKRFAEKHREEIGDNGMPEEMGYEAEPVMTAVVVHSMVSDEVGTRGQAGETAPVVFDRQEAILLSPTGATNISSFSFDV